jgi:hypothetical protein
MAKKIDLVIKSTLDKAGFDAASKSVKTLEAEVSAGASNFDKFGNVSQAVSSAISGDIKGVTGSVFNLTKSLKNVGGALGGLAAAAGPVALVATVAVGAYNAIKTLGENIKKAREEAEKARIERQAAALRDLKTIYGELTAQVERYAKIQGIAADNAIKMQTAANGLQQSQLSARMNEELKNAPAEKHDEIRQRYSRYAQDVKDAQELKNIELEMAKNEAEIAKQEKLASEAVRFYNSQLDAKNRLISDTAKRIAGAEDFKGTSDEAMAKAAEDSAVRQAVEAEKQARAAMESAQAELMKLKAAQDVAKVRAAEVKQNSANARAAREIEDRAKLEAEHQKALDEALEKKAQLADKVAEAEKALVRAQEQERNQARTKELQEQLDLMQQQVAAAKQLLGIANQGGNRGRVRNLEDADKAAKKAAREEERQRKRDDARLKSIENRSLGGKFARDVNGNWYLRSMTGEDITGRLRGKDAEFVRRLNELNAAEQAANMANANANAVKRQIEDAQNAGQQNPVQAAKDAVDAAKKEAEAAQEAIDKIENKFAADITSLSEAIASYQSDLEAVVREVNAPAAAAVETLNSNFADLKVALRTLLTAQ